MIKKIFGFDRNLASLITRLIVGGIFIYSGWIKVTDMPTMLGYFSSMHIPTFLTYIVSYGELIGGVLLVLGLWTSYAALFLSMVMIVAVYLTIPLGFAMFGLPLTMLGALLSVTGNGGGKYSIGNCKGCGSCGDCRHDGEVPPTSN